MEEITSLAHSLGVKVLDDRLGQKRVFDGGPAVRCEPPGFVLSAGNCLLTRHCDWSVAGSARKNQLAPIAPFIVINAPDATRSGWSCAMLDLACCIVTRT